MKWIVFSGLPGTGKSMLAEAMGRELEIPVLAKDWLEAVLLQNGLQPTQNGKSLGYVGYELLTTLAERQLMLGQSVILDSVAGISTIREQWRALADHFHADWRVVECLCSDETIHRARLLTRERNIPGWHELAWSEVERVKEYYLPWHEDRLVLDMVRPFEENLSRVMVYCRRFVCEKYHTPGNKSSLFMTHQGRYNANCLTNFQEEGMTTIDLTIEKSRRANAIERARERNIIIPTYAQMKDPSKIPAKIKEELKDIGLWDIHPRNLFRINWHNEPTASGGTFGGVNYLELPSSLTGVPARIIVLVGKWFPTGAHKVGAAFSCLVPRLVTGQFDPTTQKAVWPSTGNYCRGGAYDSALLACESIAILPEGMSRERFEWLAQVAGETIKTPGSESNVKEIFDKCWELRKSGQDLMIFNQFDEFGNYLWHYEVTGHAMEEVLKQVMGPNDRYRGMASATGSAGTIASGDYMKELFPDSKIVASEALQCPTLLENGFGAHRIEGIGDKHVPWIHNTKNTDMIVAIDDNAVVNISRLFNEETGRAYLVEKGVPENIVGQLDLLGFSGISNVLSAIKAAKYYEMDGNDIMLTVLTDSMELYRSRLHEMHEEYGQYGERDAAADFARYLHGQSTDNLLELRYTDRRRVHNLKYFTWVEQQGKTYEEIQDQWYEPNYWTDVQKQADEIDELIVEFNGEVGLM